MRRLLAAGLLLCAAVSDAWAGGWDVNPIRVDLDARVRTGAVTVHNDGERALRFQVSLAEWTQDADGKDAYAPSRDLVFFPQIMSLEPDERQVVRVGSKQGGADAERAYRLFIEEIPDPDTGAQAGTSVAVRVRFGVPVFIAAATPRAAAEIERIERRGEVLEVRVHNGGNGHFKIDRLVLSRAERDVGETAGWYVLPSATRAFSLPLGESLCAAEGPLELRLEGAGVSLRRDLDRDSVACAH